MEKGFGLEVPGGGEELEALRQRHQELEKRLATIDRHLSLTADEQTERAVIKKEKLRVKDRMLALTAGRPRAPVV